MKATSGYRLVLPPGSVQVPVRDSVPGTAHAVISAAFRRPPEGIPRDAFTSARIERERRLEKMIRKARQEGGLELFLACDQAYANLVPASFLIAEGTLASATDDPLAAAAMRPSLRAEYTVPRPASGSTGRRMVITFSPLGDGDPSGEPAATPGRGDRGFGLGRAADEQDLRARPADQVDDDCRGLGTAGQVDLDRAFPRKRLVKFCTRRFRGNVMDTAARAMTIRRGRDRCREAAEMRDVPVP